MQHKQLYNQKMRVALNGHKRDKTREKKIRTMNNIQRDRVTSHKSKSIGKLTVAIPLFVFVIISAVWISVGNKKL